MTAKPTCVHEVLEQVHVMVWECTQCDEQFTIAPYPPDETGAPQLCTHDDGSWCNEECARKLRAFREYHGLPAETTAAVRTSMDYGGGPFNEAGIEGPALKTSSPRCAPSDCKHLCGFVDGTCIDCGMDKWTQL